MEKDLSGSNFRPALYQYLGFLTPKELDKWVAYVHSPYATTHPHLPQLATHLAALYPEFSSEAASRKALFTFLFPGQPFQDQRIMDYMSYLKKLTEEFLVFQRIREDRKSWQVQLETSLIEKGAGKLYQQAVRRREKKPVLSPDLDHYFFAHQHARLHLDFVSAQKQRGWDTALPAMTGLMDQWYLITRLRYACAQLNRSKVLSEEGDQEFVEKLVELGVEKMPAGKGPLLWEAYFALYQMMTQEPGQAAVCFRDLRSFLEKNADRLPMPRLHELYAYLMNFCIQRINLGQASYREILLELYQFQLEKGLLLEEGWLSPWDYKNIVSLALKMKRFAWTLTFIETYRGRLNPQFRENAYAYNLAAYHQSQGQHQESLQLLIEVKLEDVFYGLGTRTMLAKSYFETADLEALFYLLDAFEAWLRRLKGVSAYQREIYLHFIRRTRKLAQYKGKMMTNPHLVSARQLGRLRESLDRNRKIAQWDWLGKQLETLEQFHP
ncbi:MAG: hypothetical protein AAFR61_09145 [Bacteroidota bacterium]